MVILIYPTGCFIGPARILLKSAKSNVIQRRIEIPQGTGLQFSAFAVFVFVHVSAAPECINVLAELLHKKEIYKCIMIDVFFVANCWAGEVWPHEGGFKRIHVLL